MDDFNAGDQDLTSGVGFQFSILDTNSAIGGERDLAASNSSIDVNTSNPGSLTISTSGGSSFAGVTWDGDDNSSGNSFTGLGGVDFTANGHTGIEFFIVSNDVAFDLQLRAFPFSGGTGTLATATVPAGLSNTSFVVPFASFSNAAVFNSVGQFDFSISGGPLNLEVDYIQTAVPEPGAVLFCAIFATGIAIWQKLS